LEKVVGFAVTVEVVTDFGREIEFWFLSRFAFRQKRVFYLFRF